MGSCVIRQKRIPVETRPQSFNDAMNCFNMNKKLMSAEARCLIYEIKDSKAPILNLQINSLYLKRIVKNKIQ
ncbi:hypothetical protein SteCoe_25850 [Stentor coeruleus]|uniref:Uncharacterized protein n=1 Tax=Stentor coeruleus TaxID=5963 RepID=A0A1R2BEL0_9CILI|nr:hypothetical protein SteCoe_25850 [Stentor coeruleus]